MFIALLIVARAVHIAASILIAGTFTFDVVALGFARLPVSDDLREVERSLVRLTVWILVLALVSAVLWLWLEVLSMTGLSFVDSFLPARGRPSCLKPSLVMFGSFAWA